MEENRVLKGFLIPFLVIAAVVIAAAVIMNTSYYKQIRDTTGYGEFTERGYTSEALGLTLLSDGEWLFLNGEKLYDSLSPVERLLADKANNDYGTELILGMRRPFIELTAEVNTESDWKVASFTEKSFVDNELPRYAEKLAKDGFEITDWSFDEKQKNCEPCAYFVIEYADGEKRCAYVSERFNSSVGGVEIYGTCERAERADEVISLFCAVADGDENLLMLGEARNS